MFCSVGTIPSTAVMCCCSRVSGAGVAGTEEVGGVEGPAPDVVWVLLLLVGCEYACGL
jgi:hypothetical protein